MENKVYRIRLKGTDRYWAKTSGGFSARSEYAFAGDKRARQRIKQLLSYRSNSSDFEIVEFEEKRSMPVKLFNAPEHIRNWNQRTEET